MVHINMDIRSFCFCLGKISTGKEAKDGGTKNKLREGRMLKLGVTSPYLHKYVV
jgi:hypothetical protein